MLHLELDLDLLYNVIFHCDILKVIGLLWINVFFDSLIYLQVDMWIIILMLKIVADSFWYTSPSR